MSDTEDKDSDIEQEGVELEPVFVDVDMKTDPQSEDSVAIPLGTRSYVWRAGVVLARQWFIIGVVMVIGLALVDPHLGRKGGPLHPEFTVKVVAVSLIFFLSGVGLKTQELKAAILHVRLHIFVHTFSLVLVPCLVFTCTRLARTLGVRTPLLEGFEVLSCLPAPVSSAVILTKAVGGNEAAAIFNSTLGSLLGIVLTPALMLVLIGVSGEVQPVSVFVSMSQTVALPLLVGQGVRALVGPKKVTAFPIRLGAINSVILLLIIYSAFCNTFAKKVDVRLVELALCVTVVMLMQLALLALSFTSATRLRWLRLTRTDVACTTFVSTHKSLTLGISIINVVFDGDARLFHISLPLLVYHPVQILLGSVLVPYLKAWVQAGPHRRHAPLEVVRVAPHVSPSGDGKAMPVENVAFSHDVVEEHAIILHRHAEH